MSECFHVKAWGHPTKPDIDQLTDDPDLGKDYPCRCMALRIPITRQALDRALKQHG